MCGTIGGYSIRARDYFTEAKKKNRHLKKLKSVSRAYRKSAVRELKAKAAGAKEAADRERQERIERNLEALQKKYPDDGVPRGWLP